MRVRRCPLGPDRRRWAPCLWIGHVLAFTFLVIVVAARLSRQQVQPAEQALCRLRTRDELAARLGALLGRGEVLLRGLPACAGRGQTILNTRISTALRFGRRLSSVPV